MVRRRIAGWRSSRPRAFSMLPESGEGPTRRVPCASPAMVDCLPARRRGPRSRSPPACSAQSPLPAGGRDARPARRHGDAPQRAQPRRARVGRHDRTARDPAAASRWSTCPRRWCASRASSRTTGRTTRRTSRSARAASARAPRSACAACASTRTTSRRRCRTARDRPAASRCSRPSASRCCAGRSRRSTATRRAASSRCSPSPGTTAPEVDALGRRRQLRHVHARRQGDGDGARRRLRDRGEATFETDGYRDHSAARRELGVAKLAVPLGAATRLTLLGTLQHQPDSQDPLGLTRAQWEADPRQADPAADAFDTRKSIDQQQGGVALDHRFDADTSLKLVGYGGRRDVEQYLALAGTLPASAGRRRRPRPRLRRRVGEARERGARRRGAASSRRSAPTTTCRTSGAAASSTTTAARRAASATRTTRSRATARLRAARRVADAPRSSLTAGVRANEVRFSTDRPLRRRGQSRRQRPRATTARRRRSLGVLWQPIDTIDALRVATARASRRRRSRSSPTGPARPGLNLDLDAATSRAFEIGAKAILARAPSRQRRGVRDRHRRRDRRRQRDRRPDDVPQRRQDAAPRRRARCGTATSARGRARARRTTPGSRPSSPTRSRPARRRVVVPAGNRLPGVPEQRRTPRSPGCPPALPWLELGAEVQHVVEALRQRPQHRRRAGVDDRATCARA